MSILVEQNVRTLNSKYNTIINTNTINNDWQKTTLKILFSINNSCINKQNKGSVDSYNTLYNQIYSNYSNGTLDIKVLINNFKNQITTSYQELISNKFSLIQQFQTLENFIIKLNNFISIFDYKQIKYEGKTVKYYLYNTLANIIFKESNNADDLIKTLIINLINNSEKVSVIFPIIGKILTNGLSDYQQLDMNNENNEQNNYKYFVSCIYVQLNKYLKELYDQNDITIVQLFDIINNIGNFMNSSFVPDSNLILYQSCYLMWVPILINNITLENKEIGIIFALLKNVEPYVGSNIMANDIMDKIIKLINDKLVCFTPLTNNLSDIKLYEELVQITSLGEILLDGWIKYSLVLEKLNEKLNEIFTQEIIEYYHVGFKKCIEQNILNDQFQKKYINSFISTLRTKEADRSIINYYTNIQHRYINMLGDGKIAECKQMILIDNMIIDHIQLTIKNNTELELHIKSILEKIKNIINDINISFLANQEIKTTDITFVDKIGNKLLNQSNYLNDNTSFMITSGGNNWSETSKHISNHFDINYSNELKYIINTFNEFYKEKCPQRNLKWLNDYSTVILKYQLKNKSYKLKLTLLQSSVLMLFTNECMNISFDNICTCVLNNVTDLTKIHIKKVCESLVTSKILNKNDDVYEINNSLKLPKQYIDTPANIANIFFKSIEGILPKETTKKIDNEIEYDRINTMKCHLIKITKGNKDQVFSFSELKNELENKLTLFNFTDNDLKNVIELLTKSYYLDIHDNGYKYVDE